MSLIDPRITNLVIGFETLKKMEQKLLARWQQPLNEAYNRRLRQHHAAEKKYRQRRKQLPLILSIAGGLMVVIFIMLYLLQPAVAWLLLGAAVLLLGSYALYMLVWGEPPRPKNPLRSPLKNELFQPPLPAWYARLNGSLPTPEKHGDKELQDFVKLVQATLDPRHLILYEIQPKPGDDVDLLIIGPKGIWLFEAKFWAGENTWQRGQWQRQKIIGTSIENLAVSQPPGQQWQRMVRETKETLRRGAQKNWSLMTTFQSLDIKGGILFTHTTATYDIAPDFPFEWGTPVYWQQKLSKAPILKEMTDYIILSATEAILKRHQELNRNGQKPYSMLNYAEELGQQAEKKLQAWL